MYSHQPTQLTHTNSNSPIPTYTHQLTHTLTHTNSLRTQVTPTQDHEVNIKLPKMLCKIDAVGANEAAESNIIHTHTSFRITPSNPSRLVRYHSFTIRFFVPLSNANVS